MDLVFAEEKYSKSGQLEKVRPPPQKGAAAPVVVPASGEALRPTTVSAVFGFASRLDFTRAFQPAPIVLTRVPLAGGGAHIGGSSDHRYQ